MKIEYNHMEEQDQFKLRQQLNTYTKEEIIDRYVKKSDYVTKAISWGMVIAFVVGLIIGGLA